MQEKEDILIQQCLSKIEEQLHWGAASSWHSNVFDELSELIAAKTGVLLSPTTLKRVWGKVNYDSAPSISTLNTLAQFVGYANWRDFKTNSSSDSKAKTIKTKSSNNRIIITSAAALTLLFISLFSMIGLRENKRTFDYSNIQFSSRPVAEGLPSSVVFDFDLDGIVSDSIYIQQFWDVTKTIKINQDQTQATGIYYFPGYFRSKLLIEGEIIKEHDLFIKATEWIATVDYEPVPKFVTKIQKEILSLPDEIFDEIKTYEEPLLSTFHLVNNFGDVSADHFELETTIRNTYNDKWAVCQTTRIVVLGTSGAMIIPFSIPGCVSDIGLLLNDVYYSGKEHDLSALGVDLSEYTKINIAVDNKNIRVSIEGKEVMTGKYNDPIGRLVGVRYRFLGAGEVSSLSIDPHSNHGRIDLLNQ